MRGGLAVFGATLRLFKFSHLRPFLLRRHFALIVSSPDITKEISPVIIKRIAQKITENL
jgi:hypothetical protein